MSDRMGGGIVQASLSDGCAVCGSLDVERDEVLEGGVLGLAECVRCRHRWTERPLRPVVVRSHAAEAEIATAA